MDTLNIGKMQVGNNHTSEHLFKDLREDADRWQDAIEFLQEQICGSDVTLIYSDKFGNPYAEVWDSEELYDAVKGF